MVLILFLYDETQISRYQMELNMQQINLGTYLVSAKMILESIKQIQEENPDISINDIFLSSEKYRDYDGTKSRSYYLEYPDAEQIKIKKDFEEQKRKKQDLEIKLDALNLNESIRSQVINWASNISALEDHYSKIELNGK